MSIVVVSGAIANAYSIGGSVWTRLSYVLGFRKLGFEVHFVEQMRPEDCAGGAADFESCANVDYLAAVAHAFGLAGSVSLIWGEGEKTVGKTMTELAGLAEAADLLINISGHLRLPALMRRFRRKVFIDQDPGYTQYWHDAGHDAGRLEDHDLFFTVGENIGRPGCPIPALGARWRPTRQPVVLDEWPVSREGARDRFTTVARWRGAYGLLEHGGRTFPLKAHEFRRFADLPCRARQSFEIALDIHPADDRDRILLAGRGWRLVDPREAAFDPFRFRRYVQSSGAEFSVAQGIYVDTGSGWISDRTVRYLASGKPALVQETGFSRNYPVGEGLVPFRTLDEAVAGAECIARDYDRHSRAARALAEEYFDSSKVLGAIVDAAGAAP